ncbi:transmembrane protein 231 isoform X2 [Leptidea sinapis]|nr:transmembrane protein 231 isoform X2 [Leptidea sinapis]XP_050670192.1 transmembrane protein 231 isoform X2 [Leptidea sinapis]
MKALPMNNQEYCSEVQIEEYDYNKDRKVDMINFKLSLNIPIEHTLSSITLLIGLDLYLTTICPLQMQSVALINKDFAAPSNRLAYYGNLELYQTSHLPCRRNFIDTTYNVSIFNIDNRQQTNIQDFIVQNYVDREVIYRANPLYIKHQIGNTRTMDIEIYLKVPETKVLYIPSILQELRWAWPQYLSLVLVLYWLFDKIKRFVFNHRLLMAWEIVPWKKINKEI